MKCPYCKAEINPEAMELKRHKHGTQGPCPECGKNIVIVRRPRGYVRYPDGHIERRNNK